MNPLSSTEAVEIGGVRYNGLELIEPYCSLWSRWLPLSDPPRPYTHIFRGHVRWYLLATLVFVVVLASLIWDAGRLKPGWRALILLAYGFLWALLGHVVWAGQPLVW